jgi:hypothetical protein
MSRDRRLQRLEQDVAHASNDPGLCFDCQPGNTYAQRIDFAWLTLRAGGKARPWDGSPVDARATLRTMLTSTPPELDRCRRCGRLTPTGEIRELRAELGLDG